ncbi:MAG: methyltransferase domain-containing protein [Candidatus Sulfotelmatobacter sp.]|jgi:SAM-dependent methyltransferase
MQRTDAPEILDSDACSPEDVLSALRVIASVNRRFGGIATTQWMVERVAGKTGLKHISLLEVGAGPGELPEIVRQNLAPRQISLDVTLLDLARSHLPRINGTAANSSKSNQAIVANALALPFIDGAFDLVSCNLFAHHLNPQQLKQFMREGLRVSCCAVLINDLVRDPLHLALVCASYPLMRHRVAWLDGLTSVRRAYVPAEIQKLITEEFPADARPQIEISRHFLYRMGIILWKKSAPGNQPGTR